MAIAVNPTLPVLAAQAAGSATQGAGGAIDGVVLQPGTIVNAQVQNVLADNLVRIAIAGLSIDVLSEIALTPGQNLQLAVSQTEDGVVRLQVVGQGGAAFASGDTVDLAPGAPVGPASNAAGPNDPLSPLERIAVSVATETAATEQQSLAPLFANLSTAAASNSLPPGLQQAVARVLAQQTSFDPNLNGGDIQNAFQKSGLFLEASLASGSLPATGGVPDLKAALIVLRQALTSTVESPDAVAPATAAASTAAAKPATASPPLVPTQAAEAAGHDLVPPQAQFAEAGAGDPAKLLLAQALLSAGPRSVTPGAALNLLQETLQQIQRATPNAADVITSPDGRSVQGNVSTTTPPPPFRGALPSAQPVASASIAPDAPLSATVHHLIDDTDAALARQTLLQVASLPDRVDPSGNRIDASIPRWHFEIPFATPQGTAMAQFEISRDGGGNEVEAAKRSWQARFSLNVEPAGPVHALISLSGDRTSVRMWAERPQTAAELRAGASELSRALSQAELVPGDIVIREGTPPQVSPAKAGHFLDRAL